MREVEIKAWVDDFEAVKSYFDEHASQGRPVYKEDCYFKRPGEKKQALRLRNNGGILEFTTKRNNKNEKGEENNYEYEFTSSIDQLDKAKEFFTVLGYEHHFIKRKKGFDWDYRKVHVELLEVDGVGVFLEMEALIDFDANEEEVQRNIDLLYSILDEVNIPHDRVERRSYRAMILKEE